MIIINFKNYKTGKDLLKLAKLIESYDLHFIAAVPTADIEEVSQKTSLNVYAQHVDYVDNEKSTGFVSARSVKEDGATGTLLNHSEHPLKLDMLKKTIEQCRKNKLITIVCAKNLDEVKEIEKMKPDAIAFEDPELISTGKSVTKYKSGEIVKFVRLLKGKGIIPICGAGISGIEDVKAAYNLGCKGVLIASAISNSPQNKAEAFLKAIKDFESSGA